MLWRPCPETEAMAGDRTNFTNFSAHVIQPTSRASPFGWKRRQHIMVWQRHAQKATKHDHVLFNEKPCKLRVIWRNDLAHTCLTPSLLEITFQESLFRFVLIDIRCVYLLLFSISGLILLHFPKSNTPPTFRKFIYEHHPYSKGQNH